MKTLFLAMLITFAPTDMNPNMSQVEKVFNPQEETYVFMGENITVKPNTHEGRLVSFVVRNDANGRALIKSVVKDDRAVKRSLETEQLLTKRNFITFHTKFSNLIEKDKIMDMAKNGKAPFMYPSFALRNDLVKDGLLSGRVIIGYRNKEEMSKFVKTNKLSVETRLPNHALHRPGEAPILLRSSVVSVCLTEDSTMKDVWELMKECRKNDWISFAYPDFVAILR